MKLLTVAYYELLKNMKDKKMFIVWILTPIIMIYILGNAIDNYFLNDIENKIPIGFVNEDNGFIGEAFKDFIESKEIMARIELNNYDDKSLADEALDKGEIDALVYIPKNLSLEIQQGNSHSIILSGKNNVEFIEGLVKGFISSYNSINAIIQVGGNPTEAIMDNNIERIFYSQGSKTPKSIDYYSVLTLLQILIMGAILGVYIVSRANNSDMYIRMHAVPMSKWTLIVGRILGSVTFLLGMSILVMLFTKFIYNANWDGNILIILGAFIIFSTIIVGLGILIGLLIPNTTAAIMVVLLMMMFFGIISGAVSPATTGSLGYLSPNFHAKILIFGTIYAYPKQVMWEAAIWLAGFVAIVYGLLAVMFRRLKYDNI